MPQPAFNIISRALQRAKIGNVAASGTSIIGFGTQALQELNSLLDFIAETVDFAAAMGTWFFTFNPNLVNLGNGNITISGPNYLPIDYLRVQTSGGATGAQRSSKWYLQGVPYDMVEIDLTEFDDQVQQAGMQSYPYFWAKDLSQRQITSINPTGMVPITGDLSTATTTVYNLPTLAGISVGMSIAGGIGPVSLVTPGTTITATNVFSDATVTGTTNSTTALTNLSTNVLTNGWRVGMTITGAGIPVSTTIAAIAANGLSLTLSQAATASASGVALTVTSNELTLSRAPSLPNGATVTLSGASLMIGYPGAGYPYPPPSGAFQAMIRYQRLMPPLTMAQVNAGAYCWFPDDDVLIDGLTGKLLEYSDDSRSQEFIGGGLQSGDGGGKFGRRMAAYIRTADDKSDRAQAVQLDRRTFGSNFSTLPSTKLVGW